jgi:hypothetical protein
MATKKGRSNAELLVNPLLLLVVLCLSLWTMKRGHCKLRRPNEGLLTWPPIRSLVTGRFHRRPGSRAVCSAKKSNLPALPVSVLSGGSRDERPTGNDRMTDEQQALADRIAALEARVAELGSFLHLALGYLSSDPASSLTKSRVVLEKVLLALYRGAMKKEPARPMIGDMLSDKAFTGMIPRRIAARMNAIRDMSNLGPHGEEVHATDAIRVMRDLIDVLEWYVVHHDPGCQITVGQASRQALEILPQLRAKYPRYLRPNITSVRFVQSQDRCYLEITTDERIREDLMDETSKRTDLAFISNSSRDDDVMFNPARSITENASRFVSDFDVVGIINCTDLFTHEAAMRIDAHWQKYGVVSDKV